jgi:hypothetical protein
MAAGNWPAAICFCVLTEDSEMTVQLNHYQTQKALNVLNLFISFVVNDTFCDRLDAQKVFVVDVVAQVITAIRATAQRK